jgi:hypothetical protein
MREDNRDQLDEKFAEELLNASLNNYHSAEPIAGLEERVLANLRRQSQSARPVSWKWTSAMIAAVAVLIIFAVDHLIFHQIASGPAIVAVSNSAVPQTETEVKVARVESPARSFPTSRRISSRRGDLALNLNTLHENERPSSSLQFDDVRITEIRLDDIVISSNDR